MKPMLALALAMLLSASAWGRDPWKDKEYKNWDANDVRKILYDSPWSKRVSRTALQAPEGPAEDVSGVDMMDTHSKEAEASADTQQTVFVVRWVSSRTLREAWSRSLVLQKQISPESIDQHLPPVPGEYLLAVVGPSMGAFAKSNETTLKNKSYLAVGKQRIRPVRVEIDQTRDGKINGVVFHFAKTDATGKPLLAGSEKDLRFVERGAAAGFEVNFNPRQMVDSQGPDL
jgi:hypothetical protein